jgi:hypothetical protein
MKTVQDLINEERERKNPKYEDILIQRNDGGVERFSAPANIKEYDGWIEFDTTCDMSDVIPDFVPITRHIKTKGKITEFVEKYK